MFYSRRGLKNAKFRRGGGTLVALSLAVLGVSVFSFGNVTKAGNGNRNFITTSGSRNFLGKRGISEVSGSKSSYPGSTKRQILGMIHPGDNFLNGTMPSTWIIQNRDGDSVITIKSDRSPMFLGWDGDNAVYQVKTQDGGLSSVKVTNGGTGWTRVRDIKWINGN